jgi:palmitoyltransferase
LVLERAKQCVEVLLRAGAKMSATDSGGKTPLHHAAFGRKVCVQLPLRAGADKNAMNEPGKMPLHKSAGKRHEKCVELLLRAEADKDTKSRLAGRPFMRQLTASA